MVIKSSESGSDVSSDSSWTVIEEISVSVNVDNNEKETPNKEEGIEIVDNLVVPTSSDSPKTEANDFVKVTFSDTSMKTSSDDDESEKKKTKENGFLTFDEYLQERMLEHDYEYPNHSVVKNKMKKSKKFCKDKKKCKAETVGVLSLCASLLTVTGIALLCLIFPESIESKNFESVKSNYQSIVNNDSLDYTNIAASFNKTMEILDTANSSKLFSKCADSLMKSKDELVPYRRPIGPELRNSKDRLNRKQSSRSTNIFLNDMCYPKEKNNVCYADDDPKLLSQRFKRSLRNRLQKVEKREDNITSSNSTAENVTSKSNCTALSTIQSVLASTNLRSIIRSIIHDICMLKLITFFNKTKNSKDSRGKSNKGQKKTSKRIILETISDGISKISLDEAQCKRKKLSKEKCKTKKQSKNSLNGSVKTAVSVIPPSVSGTVKIKSSSSFSDYDSINAQNVVELSVYENGKSECERRFEELDNQRKKSKEACCKHKINIQHIKQKYRSEIDAIRTSDVEPIVRLHRMQNIRENYRLQLKRNREFYIREMCKMKRVRVKMLKDLCSQKIFDRELKDASVGNYIVPINQDFYSRLQEIKQRESSCTPLYSSALQGRLKSERNNPHSAQKNLEVDGEKKNPSKLTFLQNQETEMCPRSKTQLKNVSKHPCSNIPSVFGLSLNFDLHKPEQNSIHSITIEKEQDDSEKEQLVEKISAEVSGDVDKPLSENRKNGQGNLYQFTFEKKADVIRKSDNIKWHQQRLEQWEKYRKDLSKQDPQKGFKPNIMLYKY